MLGSYPSVQCSSKWDAKLVLNNHLLEQVGTRGCLQPILHRHLLQLMGSTTLFDPKFAKHFTKHYGNINSETKVDVRNILHIIKT
jgi:hypothetical protein